MAIVDTRVNDLIINKMSQAQYDALQDKSPTELYIVEGESGVEYAECATTMPNATSSNVGKILQYIGSTDANYTQGHFYKCVNNSGTYSWEEIEVQSAGDSLPDQTGQSGKYLTTNGTTASWAEVDALPTQTSHSGELLTTNGTTASWNTKANLGISGVTFRTWGGAE